jgi:class 3 adenylate cyclase
MSTSDNAQDEPWLAAATECLGHDVDSVRRLARARRGRMLAALSALARPGGPSFDPELVELLQLVRIPQRRDGVATHELARLIDRGTAAGINPASLPQVLQAYVRGVGRIAAAETSVLFDALRAVASEERQEIVRAVLDELLPLGVRGFDLLHRAMLQDALLEGSGSLDAPSTDVERLAIGMVDLVGSTAHLKSVGVDELERLADAIFTAGQGATLRRQAHIFKYAGDGMFIASVDVSSVADAALDIVAELERELPLRARGGISFGRVVQRAGDVFGLAVNMAQALTKAARPGTVLLHEDAAAELPAARRGRLRQRRLPHAALGVQTVATLHAADPAGGDPEPAPADGAKSTD